MCNVLGLVRVVFVLGLVVVGEDVGEGERVYVELGTGFGSTFLHCKV
jgi:hypothetical protein